MRNHYFAAAAAVAILAMAGSAMAQSRAAEQRKTDQLAQQIKTQITALGPNASAADVQAAINSTIANSGDTPAEAYAAIQAVAAANPGSSAIQVAANASATVVLQSAGATPQAQAQVRAAAAPLAQQAVLSLGSNVQVAQNSAAVGSGNQAVASFSSGPVFGNAVTQGGAGLVSPTGGVTSAAATAVGGATGAPTAASVAAASSSYR